MDIRSFAHAHGYPLVMEVWVREATNSHFRCQLFIYVKANVAEAWSFLLETGSVGITTHLYNNIYPDAQALLTYVNPLFPIKRAQTSIKGKKCKHLFKTLW